MQEPVVLSTSRRELVLTEYKKRHAQTSDYSTLLTEPTIISDIETGRISVVYIELDDDCTQIVHALKSMEYDTNVRTDGMLTTSKTIGYHPRNVVRRDFCTTARSLVEFPAEHALISKYAKQVATYYQQYNPELYETHQQMTDKVLPEWKLEESIFTSGIVNKNNPLVYHFDTGNFKSVWSNMLVFKQDIEGGYLAVPEYDVGFELKNNSLLMFDGQSLLHGVTPIRKLKKDAHRFSIVYYSLQKMWECLPPGEELDRIRKLRTQREEKRNLGQTMEDVIGKDGMKKRERKQQVKGKPEV